MPLRDWLQLSLCEGIGPILTARIVEAAGDAQTACAASVSLLRNVEGIGAAKADQIARSLRAAGAAVDAELERASLAGAAIIARDDDSYPELLRAIPDPPPVLYI